MVPFLKSPMRVEAEAHRPPNSRVNNAPIVIVHIRLSELVEAGSPARLMHGMLHAYFRHTRPDELVYIDAPYSFNNMSDAEEFRTALEVKLAVLDRYCVGARRQSQD